VAGGAASCRVFARRARAGYIAEDEGSGSDRAVGRRSGVDGRARCAASRHGWAV
jgi:hypothetical protein